MLSYVYYGTRDLIAATAFYDAVLAPLEMARVNTHDPKCDAVSTGWGMYDESQRQELAFWVGIPVDGNPATTGNGVMVAFRAQRREQVDAFHAAALAAGGTSEGAPGTRPQYGPDFYCAYIRDLDGNKLAAVCW